MYNKFEVIKLAKRHLITSILETLEPIVIDRVYNTTIIDINGKEYIDCFSGISVVNIGHTREEIITGSVVRIQPPLTIFKEQLDKAVEVLNSAIKKVVGGM